MLPLQQTLSLHGGDALQGNLHSLHVWQGLQPVLRHPLIQTLVHCGAAAAAVWAPGRKGRPLCIRCSSSSSVHACPPQGSFSGVGGWRRLSAECELTAASTAVQAKCIAEQLQRSGPLALPAQCLVRALAGTTDEEQLLLQGPLVG